MPKKKLLYTNCWEDADVLLAALNPGPTDQILSIGSAGDNSFSLLSKGPAQVVVYDVLLPQLHLIELKKAAFARLEYADFLAFLGFAASSDRLEIYREKVAHLLSPSAKTWWEDNIQLIQKGVIHCGKLEHYFTLFRKYILPIVASKQDVEHFFAGPKQASDYADYRRRLANPFFHRLLRFFLSEPVLKATGRQPAFFKESNIHLSKFLFEKFSAFILNPSSHQNYFMSYAAKGHFENGLPHYARKDNFEAIRAHLDKMVLRHGTLQAGLQEASGTTLINASDIFEYLPEVEFRAFGEHLAERCPALKRIAYWNFVVDRVLSETCPMHFKLETQLSTELTERDKVYFYKRFLLETKLH